MPRRKIFHTLLVVGSFLLGAGLLAWLVQREGLGTIVSNILLFGVLPFAGYVFLSLVNFTVYVWRWYLILRAHLPKDQKISFWRLYMHRMTGYAIGYLTPAAQVAGEPARIAMLSLDGVPVKAGTSAVTLDIAFELVAFVLFVMAGFGFAVLGNFEGLDVGVAVGILGVILGFLLLFFSTLKWGWGFLSPLARRLMRVRSKRIKTLAQWIVEMETMMAAFLQKSVWLLVLVTVLSFCTLSFRVIEMFYLSHFFGVDLTFGQAFLGATIPGLVLLLPIPGGLGLYEGSYTSVFAALGIPLNGVAFTFIVRLRDLIFIVIGVVHLLRVGGNAAISKGASYAKRT
ncbi:MAG: lysylphosphatidylglycerol synthase transmembrane domain-containing protein [Patescibacteria group bacterium]